MAMITMYDCFRSWEEFENAVQRHIDSTFQPFVKVSAKRVEAHNKHSRHHQYPTDMVYVYKSYKCTHRGNFKSKGCGKYTTKSCKEGCTAKIQGTLDKKDKRKIVVTAVDERHNHEIGEHLYKKYPQNRCLTRKERAYAYKLISLNVPNKDLRKELATLTGKEVTLGDIISIKTMWRKKSLSKGSHSSPIIWGTEVEVAEVLASGMARVETKKEEDIDPIEAAMIKRIESIQNTPRPSAPPPLEPELAMFRGLVPSLANLTESNKKIFLTRISELLTDILNNQ